MPSNIERRGETVALKKRKREKQDEERSTRKKPRAKSKTRRSSDAEPTQNGDDNGQPMEAMVQSKTASIVEQKSPSSWSVSKPMGGRMLNVDPIFSPDEQHFILTYNTSIQVYSTADSLLVRRIPLQLHIDDEQETVHIVSALLSKASPENIWVSCSDGRIWNITWTTGAGADEPLSLPVKKVLDVSLELVEINEVHEDILFVLEKKTYATARLMAYNRKALLAREGVCLHTCEGPGLVACSAQGQAIVVATKTNLHLGNLDVKGKLASLESLRYRWHSFEVPDPVTCIDLRTRPQGTKQKGNPKTLDLVLGCARGFIFLYEDVFAKYATINTDRRSPPPPVRLHWHRRSVHSVKWSRDGHYLISGGAEATLVSWQLDTGKCDFLPHLSATIENIVVSPTGSSYAIHLDDNSIMILSTAEMKPTAYVSGIQALAFQEQPSKDGQVRRIWKSMEDIFTPLATAMNPNDPSQLLLCVGNGQATQTERTAATPLVQAFDLSSFQSSAKHALARTNPSAHDVTNKGHPIVDPRVSHLAFSHNGKWLASVDEWQPPARDIESIVDGAETVVDACQERREIHLKFWELNSSNPISMELVTRVNEAHRTTKPESIFGLASDPASTRFATIGNDARVKLWSPRLIKRDGLAATGPEGQALKIWVCSQNISLGETIIQDQNDLTAQRSGAITFSEDGSVIFAAFGGPYDAVLYVISAETGEIRDRLHGLFRGEIRAIHNLSSCLVMLSEDLTVYDIVTDELRYGFSLNETLKPGFPLTQLSVNHLSQTFALAVPLPEPGQAKLRKGTKSEFTVFSIEDSQPQLVRELPTLITSVVSVTASSGFLIVDSAAQIWSVTEGAEPAPLVQPLVDIHLDKELVDTVNGDLDIEEDADQDEEMQDADQDLDDIHEATVGPQALADIFDAAPAFAMPPIEDVFYQVSKLFSARSLTT